MSNDAKSKDHKLRVAASVDRRSVIRTALAASAAGATGAGVAIRPDDAEARTIQGVSFTHGVASGDPTATSVILWTRVINGSGVDLSVEWRVSLTPDMAAIVRTGTAVATAARDYTVKLDATGLTPGTTYYYQFGFRDAVSPVGVTRTLPVGAVANLKFAVFSCANFERGYFNVYREAAARNDLTAVLHLGDYIYEYGPNEYGPTPAEAFGLVRPVRSATVQPQRECVTLADYRQRYATYRSDPSLQELHRKNPWICIWDDHETANDSWKEGAENHDPDRGEGSWAARVAAAVQAFHEWLPIRDNATGNLLKIWRSFDFGNLARLVMVDTRLIGRDEQLGAQAYIGNWTAALQGGGYPFDRLSNGQTRSLLGAEQEAFVAQQMIGSTQTWQILGNQILVHYESAVNIAQSPRLTNAQRTQLIGLLDQLFPGQAQTIVQLGVAGLPLPDTSDWWIGYPTARDALYRIMAQSRNPVVLSGDTHNAWGVNLRARSATGYTPIGVELATAGVSSPGYEETVPVVAPDTAVGLISDASQLLDQMVYANTHQRGWMVVDVTPERIVNTWNFVSTVFSETYTPSVGRVVEVPRDTRTMRVIG